MTALSLKSVSLSPGKREESRRYRLLSEQLLLAALRNIIWPEAPVSKPKLLFIPHTCFLKGFRCFSSLRRFHFDLLAPPGAAGSSGMLCSPLVLKPPGHAPGWQLVQAGTVELLVCYWITQKCLFRNPPAALEYLFLFT